MKGLTSAEARNQSPDPLKGSAFLKFMPTSISAKSLRKKATPPKIKLARRAKTKANIKKKSYQFNNSFNYL